MRFSNGAHKLPRVRPRLRVELHFCAFIGRILLPALFSISLALPAFCQDSGSEQNEIQGRGAEVTVTVHDSSGDTISTPAIVKILRDGTILSKQGQTSGGSVVLVVYSLGDFTVSVEAPGYENVQKDLSLPEPGRVQMDIYLRRSSDARTIAGVPGRPVLAPKAKEALEKGLQALNADKMKDAEKYVSEAVRLAPGHPDVLYVEGFLRMKQGDWPRAQAALEKATQIDPKDARAFAALGMAYCDQGKYAEAIAPLENSLQLDAAASWQTRWALAKAYYGRARYDNALKMSYEALAASNGKAPEIVLLVAQSLTAVGRYEDAAKLLREFVKEHGDRQEAATARRWLEGLATNGKIRASQN